MTKRKYKLQKKNKYSNKRFRKIYIGTGVTYVLVVGTIFLVSSLKLNKIINDYESSSSYQNYEEILYASETDPETKLIIEKCNSYLDNEKENLEKAIEYLNSSEYLMELSSASSQNIVSTKINDLVNDNIVAKIPADTREKLTEEEYYIKLYCDIYQLDYEKVYNRLSELTDNFTIEEYLKGHIPDVTFKKNVVYFETKEATILAAVRCCAQLPDQMGLSNIKIDINYDTDMTIEQQVSYFSDVLTVDKALVYSIIKSETSLKNYSNNNMGNLKLPNEGWMKFGNITQSIIETCAEIKKFNLQGRFTIDEIGEKYAPVEDNNENWLPNVKDNYQMALLNYDELFSLENSSLSRY